MRIAWSANDNQPATPAPQAAPAPSYKTPDAIRQLAEVLLKERKVSREALREALSIQRRDGGFLGQILIDIGAVDENSLTSFLAKQCKIPHLSILDYLIDKELLKLVPKEVCIEYQLVPVDKMAKNLTIAMVNPLDSAAIAQVQMLCPDLRIKPILCTYNHYLAVVNKIFGESSVGPKADGPAEASLTSFGLAPGAAKSKSGPKAPAPATPPPQQAGPSSPVEVKPAAGTKAMIDGDAPLDGGSVLGLMMRRDDDDLVEAAILEDDTDDSASISEVVDVMRDSMRDTYAVLARRMPIFRGMEPEEVAKVFAAGMTSEHEGGAVIFNSGDTGRDLFVVMSGEIEVGDGKRFSSIIGPGEPLGEMAWVSDAPRSLTATALERTSMLTLNEDVVRQLLSKESSVQLLMNIILAVSERLRAANSR